MIRLKDVVEHHPVMTEKATILCADGWAWIIASFLNSVAALERRHGHEGSFRLRYADEQMAELTMRVDYGDARDDEAFVSDVLDALDSAILRSRHYCEVCGERGTLRCDELGWLTVACEEHTEPDTVQMPQQNWRQVGGRVYEIDPETGTVNARGER
ncbi:hypothetical protein [Oricola nitratireducens]|uniref:hypothetical protein n=1 Tax=Oricola nitratireducens TaxID=2775868 RepID=UPI00186817D9|nr:hypothetical protein [Oricola nitratireducens]